jgi:hypothetical protein
MQISKVFDVLNWYLRTSDLEDDVSRNLEFTIILDRGYCITADALKHQADIIHFNQYSLQANGSSTLLRIYWAPMV